MLSCTFMYVIKLEWNSSSKHVLKLNWGLIKLVISDIREKYSTVLDDTLSKRYINDIDYSIAF